MSEEQKYGLHVTHDFVAFLTEGGKAILKFERDGTVEVGAEFKPDEAGRLAASSFSQNMSGVLSCLRDATLEEAAKVAEDIPLDLHHEHSPAGTGERIAAAIRALKETL